jgi:hypothetical protein
MALSPPSRVAQEVTRRIAVMGQDTQINPGKAGPKGALEGKNRKDKPRSGAPGNEGNNTRRDFVRLPKKSGKRR